MASVLLSASWTSTQKSLSLFLGSPPSWLDAIRGHEHTAKNTFSQKHLKHPQPSKASRDYWLWVKTLGIFFRMIILLYFFPGFPRFFCMFTGYRRGFDPLLPPRTGRRTHARLTLAQQPRWAGWAVSTKELLWRAPQASQGTLEVIPTISELVFCKG